MSRHQVLASSPGLAGEVVATAGAETRCHLQRSNMDPTFYHAVSKANSVIPPNAGTWEQWVALALAIIERNEQFKREQLGLDESKKPEPSSRMDWKDR